MTDSDSGRQPIQSGSRLDRDHGWLYRTDSGRVWNDDYEGAGWLIRTEDGDLEKHIRRAQEQIARGQSTLWTRLGTLEYDGLKLGQNTEVYHEGREEWLVADAITVTEDAEPKVRFKVKDSWPTEHVTFYGSTLQDLREDGVLKTKQEVNDQLEALLDNL